MIRYAWIGFFVFPWQTTAKRSRLFSTQQTHFCSCQLNDFSRLCDAADTQLLTGILHNPCHVLQALLTPPADHNYNLRGRPHNRQLPGRMSHLTNCNSTVQLLFSDSYLKLICLLSASAYSTLEVLHMMRCTLFIVLHFTLYQYRLPV